MSRRADVGALAKTSYWLAQTFSHVMRMQAQLAAIEPEWREKAEARNASRLADAEDRLALALEAFGDVIRGGDDARAERIVAELETPYSSTRHSNAQREYEDLIRRREDGRSLRRRLDRLQKRLARMTAMGAPASERRSVRAEIGVLEELFESATPHLNEAQFWKLPMDASASPRSTP